MKLWPPFAVFLATTFCVPSLFAQQSPDSILRFAHRQNWYVRVSGATTSIGEGRVTEIRSDGVVLGPRTNVAFAGITGVERRLNAGGGALTGGIFTGIAFGFLTAGFVHGMCESTNCHEIAAFVGGSFIGFTIGSAVGAFVVPMKHSWVKVYP